ncbi:GntR family transcriptional regulator [Streptomyces sp. V4-01]|uniref:GntR family transcriptional regulator n=1 Tax=Actinacidiphila polyblastidii TaxID=3110430 RepID=A0ABU7P4M1_9ACTN|nr:GntR family transcriptional regulator [Streptomyces sp. V4-01]
MGHLPPRGAVAAPERLRDQVADALRAALAAGELRPGRVYSAPALAAPLGVSATPVREAMHGLAREGLVEAVRNKGFRITAVTERDLDQYTEIRALIEVPTVGRVAATAAAADLEALRPVALETVEAARRHDFPGYLDADRRFHLGLLALAGNDHLVQVVGGLRDRSCRYGPDGPAGLSGLSGPDAAGRLAASAAEHLALLDLVLAGDVRGAQDCLARHLARARLRAPRAGGEATR